MLAVHLEDGKVLVRRVPPPKRREGFALVRVLAAGICNTDLELKRGYYGFHGRPGHEFIGEVVEADDKSLTGRRVVGEINLACRKCEWCRRGLGRHCPNRTVLGIVKHPGSFAELLTLPEVNLHPVPRGISNQEAVFVEPLAAACEILDQVRISRGAPVAVLGDGKLGLLAAQVLHLHGALVTLYGRHRSKLAIATRADIETRLAPKKFPLATYDVVIEATGSPAGLPTAVSMVKPRGTVVMKSTIHGSVNLDAAPVIVNEVTLVGSRCGRFEPAMRLLPRVQVQAMLSDEFPLREAPRAFDRATERGVLKVLLRP